jgi:hypothetical protein
MNCQQFSADVLRQIQKVGNRFDAQINVTQTDETVHLCANNGNHSRCVEHRTVTVRSIYLPKLEAGGHQFVVSKTL